MDLNRRMMLAALAGGAASLYRIPGALAQAEDMQKIEAAAKKEGSVIVYSAYVGAPSSKAIAAGFEKKYGIRVEILEVRGSEIRERVRVEQAAGRFQGDVLFSSVGQVWLHETVDKTVDPLPQVPNLAKLTKDFKPDPAFAPTMVIPYGILYNTNLVKAEEAPKSWAELADPKWKGKILADDFRAIGGGYMTMFAMHDNFGVPYLEKIAANTPVFTRDQRESQRRTARGEYPIYIPFILTDIPSLKGLPVKHVIPSEGVTYILYGNALLKGAPRANAAKLYIDYCLSEEGQLIYANTGHGATTVDIGNKLSPELREVATAKLWGTSDTKRQNEMLALAKKLFG